MEMFSEFLSLDGSCATDDEAVKSRSGDEEGKIDGILQNKVKFKGLLVLSSDVPMEQGSTLLLVCL